MLLLCWCRLWCAVESYKGRKCISCPQQLVEVPGNQLVCGLWQELRQLQFGYLEHNVQRVPVLPHLRIETLFLIDEGTPLPSK